MQLVFRVEAKLAQTGTDLENALLILLMGQESVGGELEERPLLINFLGFAIDDLLDLLQLLVQLDKLAGADSIVVGVKASAAADDVKDSVDVISGLVEQPVLGARVSSGNGFARNLFVTGSFDSVWGPVNGIQGHDARRVVNHDYEGGRSWRTKRKGKSLLVDEEEKRKEKKSTVGCEATMRY